MEQEVNCSFLKEAKLKLKKASKQLNLLALDNDESSKNNRKRDFTCLFDTFLYRDHVTFKNIEAKYLQKQKKNLFINTHEQRNNQ